MLNTNFAGVLLYDPAWPLYSSTGGYLAQYSTPAGVISVALVGVMLSDARTPGVDVLAGSYPFPQLNIFGHVTGAPTLYSMSLGFSLGAIGTVPSLSLPASLPGLPNYDPNLPSLLSPRPCGYATPGQSYGRLTFFTTDLAGCGYPTPVPEPGTRLLLGTGLAPWRCGDGSLVARSGDRFQRLFHEGGQRCRHCRFTPL